MRVDRSHCCEENEHFIKLSNVNKLAVNKLDERHSPCTVPTQFNRTLWT